MQVSAADVVELVVTLAAPSQSLFAVSDLGVVEEDIQNRIDSETQLDDELMGLPDVASRVQAYRDSLRESEALAATLATGFRQFHRRFI